jgi:RNA polymerase sigma-70 factor (ECF subfamily)
MLQIAGDDRMDTPATARLSMPWLTGIGADRRCPRRDPMLRARQIRPQGRLARANVINHTPDIAASGLQAAVLKYRAELFRFLTARRAPADEAEDILQDLYLKAGALDSGPVAQPRAYLYKMTANLLFDRRRTAAHRASRERLWTEAQLGPEKEIDDRPSVEQELAAREELRIVAGAIATLPERTAEILRRYRIDGDGQKAIAVDLGISLSAVEKHLQRAYRVVVEAQARLDADNPQPRRSGAEG